MANDHWNAVYTGRDATDLTWFESDPAASMTLIDRFAPHGTPAIDIGAGASCLVDHLLVAGFSPVAALDLSDAGLAKSRQRLEERASQVDWIVADVTQWTPADHYGLWHDRAAFHFLTDPADRRAYVTRLAAALRPDGVAIVATFAEDGPERCSNLPVRRYAPAGLVAEFNAHCDTRFTLLHGERHDHTTPGGRVQKFEISVIGFAATDPSHRRTPGGAG
ncbi:MAG: class I SAM-dependent methyltransferase [Marinibacterium sp.]